MPTDRSPFTSRRFLPPRCDVVPSLCHTVSRRRNGTGAGAGRGLWEIRYLLLLGIISLHGLWASESGDRSDQFVFGTGAARILSGRPLAATSTEYRFKQNWRRIHPYVAADLVSGGSYYIGAGLLYNWDFNRHWRLTVDSGPGYYDRHHSSRDLGATVEFYSNIEVSRDVGRGQRLGISFGHISNGGLGNDNPGSESLRLLYTITVD